MGTCWNCDTQLSLGEDETHCDNCGEIVFYKCNSCKEGFEIVDKATKKKLPECSLCGFFKCPHCGVCSWTCKRYDWEKSILRILLPEINQSQFKNLPEKIRAIVNFLEEQKISPDRKNCPERGVPITYAKTRIKSLLAKVEGFRVKNERDRDAFVARMNELIELPLETGKTVSATREAGSYGQEYRDAFNLLVCLGKFKIERKTNKEGDEYDLFIRCDQPACKYLARDTLIVNKCPQCKKIYPRGVKFCSECKPYQKGKNKGELVQLKEGLSNKDTCQCYRGYFTKDERLA
jgi:hypothetical protein